MDSGSGTNWIAESVLKYVSHAKRGSCVLEVHSFHGSVRKKHSLVEVYYKDMQNNTQSIMCYVHDSYIRHTKLNMANFILGQRQQGKCAPFTLPGPLADPGDSNVSHGHESQGVGLVLSPATINKLRTIDPIIRIKELDILLEPTIFGVVISGAIPEHLRSAADWVSVQFIAPRVVSQVISSEVSCHAMTKDISLTDGYEDDISGKNSFYTAKYFSKDMYIPENLALQNQVMDDIIWFTPIMCFLISMAKSSTSFIFYFLASLSNIFQVGIILGLKPFHNTVWTNAPKALSHIPNQGKSCRVSTRSAFVDTNTHATQRRDKSHPKTKLRLKSSIFYHRPRRKSPKIFSIAGHIKMIYYQKSTIPNKFVSEYQLRRVLHTPTL